MPVVGGIALDFSYGLVDVDDEFLRGALAPRDQNQAAKPLALPWWMLFAGSLFVPSSLLKLVCLDHIIPAFDWTACSLDYSRVIGGWDWGVGGTG